MRKVLAAAVAALIAAGLSVGPGVSALAAPSQTPGPGQWYLRSYGIEDLWKTTRGSGVSVAVIDSGIEDSHPDLRGTVSQAKDFSGAGKDGRTPVGPSSTIGHGTSVAGVIAGQGVDEGPVGVAPEATLLAASMWLGGTPPAGADTSRDQAAKALRWAVDSGAKVVNMSLGWDDPSWPESWDSAFAYAFEKDVVVVACVGNRSEGATRAWSPATVPGVVGVGGLTRSGTVASQSSAPGTAVSLMGPAEEIPVPYYSGGYAEARGCSFAAPVVSGVAALMRAAHPDWSADDVVARLESTARTVKGHTGKTTGDTVDPTVGYGAIDPKAAMSARTPGKTVDAATSLAAWTAMHRRAAVNATDNSDAPHASATTSQAASDDVQSATQASSSPPRLGPAVVTVCILFSGGLAGCGLWFGLRNKGSRRH